MKRIEEPKDLQIKIGSKREKFLTDICNAMQKEVDDCKNTIMLNEMFIPQLNEEIKKEKQKFK